MKTFLLALVGLLISLNSVWAETNPKIDFFCAQQPYLAKLSSDLLKMRLSLESGDYPQSSFEQYAPHAIRDTMYLQCIVGVKEFSASLINDCTKADLILCGNYTYGNLHQMVVRCYDPRQFDTLAQRSDVLGIVTEPYAIRSAGPISNEADHSIHAAEARNTFGVDGSGVRIGVLSDSIADRSDTGRIFDQFILGTPSQARLELPKKIRVLDVGDGSGDDEGTAMMELMYDLAPGVDFSFAAVRYNYAAFPKNILNLLTDPGYECDILLDDITFLKEPLYQHGPIALAAMEAVKSGVPYFAAAGNFNNNGHERPFTDVSPESDDAYPPNGKDFHDFGAAYGLPSDTHLSFFMPRNSSIILTLHWDEPYGGVFASGPGAESDLDMYLVSDLITPLRIGSNGNILASSVDVQGSENDPQGEPVEFIVYVNTDKDREVHLVIDHQKGRVPQNMHLFIVFDESNGNNLIDRPLVQDRTLMGHMVASGVVTVAAIPFYEIDREGEYIEPIEELNVGEYSALGGVLPILFSDDGYERLESPIYTTKPDVTGPDQTSTSIPGFITFEGTSAAVANVAAVAALMVQAKPSITPSEIIEAMQATAIDVEREGPDFHSGAGLVDAMRVLSLLLYTGLPFWNFY